MIDVGCLECGVESTPIGWFRTEKGAEAWASVQNMMTKGWRDGGQTNAQVFAFAVPLAPETASGGNDNG
ncbi:MAG TPA: hypothetical protein VFN70_18015 [Burkholderiales bacterium]|nr:hypothetical protein [Burkholderiales bacterium]